MSEPPLPARVLAYVPLPRRTALVPELGDDVLEEDEPPRVDALLDEPDEDDEPELLDPEEDDDPDDPLDGGAERTGCCSEYEGAVYVGDGAV